MRSQTLKRHAKLAIPWAVTMLMALSLDLASLPAGATSKEDHSHHQHHAMASAQDGYVRTTASYRIPDVKLLDPNRAKVSLRRQLDEKPVILNFIFTSCGAICPVMSTTFSQVQKALGPERNAVRMVSISIDPDFDTPEALKIYAKRYGAGPQWQMLTGSVDDSLAVQRAFNVYRGDKMGHTPATFLRARAGQPWVRLDGFASADDILREYRKLTAIN
jgi:protein SCO1/2